MLKHTFSHPLLPKPISGFWNIYSPTADGRHSRLFHAMTEMYSTQSLVSSFPHSLPHSYVRSKWNSTSTLNPRVSHYSKTLKPYFPRGFFFLKKKESFLSILQDKLSSNKTLPSGRLLNSLLTILNSIDQKAKKRPV